jgi:hypothetical protein
MIAALPEESLNDDMQAYYLSKRSFVNASNGSF